MHAEKKGCKGWIEIGLLEDDLEAQITATKKLNMNLIHLVRKKKKTFESTNKNEG